MLIPKPMCQSKPRRITQSQQSETTEAYSWSNSPLPAAIWSSDADKSHFNTGGPKALQTKVKECCPTCGSESRAVAMLLLGRTVST